MATSLSKKRVAVLISGNGSNLQSLIDASSAITSPAVISLVISNKAEAYGLTRAKNAGIPTEVISHKDFSSREAFDEAMHRLLAQHKIEYVCLAGFMRILSTPFVQKWEGRMINIHPSLLPLFKGLDTHQKAIDEGMRFAGCTVHFVAPEMDSGPIIIQAAVPILQGDTGQTLKERVHIAEHRIYPRAMHWLTAGKLSIAGNKVMIDGGGSPLESLINPE